MIQQRHPIDTISYGAGQRLVVYTTGGHRIAGFDATPPGWEGKILRLAENPDDPERGPCTNIDVAAIEAIEFRP